MVTSLYICLFKLSADKNYSSSALNSLLSGLNLIHYCKNQILIGITYNNLAAFSLFQNDFEEAFKYSEKGLTLLEAYVIFFLLKKYIFSKKKIFRKIQKNDVYDFSKNEQFINELVILLVAYMNFGVSLKYFQSNPSKSKDIKLPPKKYDSFFMNGYKLGMKYLGSKHMMTQKLNILCRISKTTTTAQTLPDLILTEDENTSKINIQGDYTSRSKEPFKPRKSNEFDKDLTSFCTQSQSSFNDESFNDFQTKNPRSFRIKTKAYTNHGLTHLKNEFSNNYVKQIRDMEETLREIQRMREFYEQEKRNLEEKNLKKQLELGYMNPGINYYGMNINNTSNNIHPANSMAGALQNNFMMHPNNLQQANPFFFPNFQHNNNIYNHPNLNNNYNNNVENAAAMIPTQRIDQINSKQNDLEQKLENLKKENEDILKEKFLKQQELNELKKMVEELKEKSRKKSFESQTSIKDNFLNFNKEQILPKEKQSISPCSSHKNLDIKKPKDKSEKNEENEGRVSHKDLQEMESPEIIAKLRNKNLSNFDKGNETNNKQQKILKNPLEDEKELFFRKVESVTLKPQEIKNNKGTIQPDQLNKTLSKIDSNQVSKNNISNNNDSACFTNVMKKKPSAQKKSLRFEKKISSSDQMLPDTNDNNKLHLNNQENKNLHKKIPSIDFLVDINNPGTLLQFFLPYFPRGFQIKKKLIFNNMNFNIDLTLLDESEQIFFLLRGVNETKKTNLKEEKLPAQLFSKILQTIDVKDVLPYEIPLKTIETFEFFMKFCVLPFIGVFFK